MKKFGFTLAEVMVALMLVGVVTSLTIPTFVENSRNRSNAAKLAATVASLESAFTSMLATEGVQDLTETRFIKEVETGWNNEATSLFSEIYKISGSEASINISYGPNFTGFKEINSNNQLSVDVTVDTEIVYKTKNGAFLMMRYFPQMRPNGAFEIGEELGVDQSVLHIVVDTNGALKPNIFGRDVFAFIVGANGVLYPAGSLGYSVFYSVSEDFLYTGNNVFSCVNNARSIGCTARLVENNYNVDY